MRDLLLFMRSFKGEDHDKIITQGQLLDAMKLMLWSVCPEKMDKAIDDLEKGIPEEKEFIWTNR